MTDWNIIIEFQNRFYPGWQHNKEKTLFSTALAGEVGEVCGVVTHLEGGGTNNRIYTSEMVLHQGVDAYIQLVLLLTRYGFNQHQFENEFEDVMQELEARLYAKNWEAKKE